MMNSDELPIATSSNPPTVETEEMTEAPQNVAPAAASEPSLETEKDRIQAEIDQIQAQFRQWTQISLESLEQQRQQLQTEIEQLERRRSRIQNEIQTTFAGSSEEIAIRVQSFKAYLLGSLQDLVVAADRLELVQQVEVPASVAPPSEAVPAAPSNTFEISDLTFAEPSYQQKTDRIRQVIKLFQNEPDYYGPPWKLRRTFDKIPAERTADWFFNQGGRGAVKTLGSRLQNILVGSAVISILYNLYGDKLRPLVLANSPERLGEWRRGLQDCLGLTRNDIGTERGPALFEFPDALVQRAERTQQDGKLPLIIIDEMEEAVNLGVLQFPLWLAFAPTISDYQQNSLYQAY